LFCNRRYPPSTLNPRPAGAAALFKGFVPMALRYTPGGGILLVAFDFMNRALAQWV
jgi:hypothetical protein